MSVFFKVYFHWQTFWWCSLKSQRKTLPAHLKSQCDLTASIHSQTMITFTSRHFLFPWVDYSSFNSAQTMMAKFGQHFFIWVLCPFRSSASIQHVIIRLQVCGFFFFCFIVVVFKKFNYQLTPLSVYWIWQFWEYNLTLHLLVKSETILFEDRRKTLTPCP